MEIHFNEVWKFIQCDFQLPFYQTLIEYGG